MICLFNLLLSRHLATSNGFLYGKNICILYGLVLQIYEKYKYYETEQKNILINWEQVRIDAAISAIQGVMESGKLGMILEIDPTIIAKQAVRVADALVDELKK